MYGILADLMVLTHLLYVGYVIVGQLAIIVASAFQWQWGRNRWFRLTHLLAIAIVALEAVMGWQCPLTRWEHQLRELAGQPFDGSETFMGRLLHDVLFIENQPESFFTVLYISMLVIVAQGLVMYPPRLRSRKAEPAVDGVATPAMT